METPIPINVIILVAYCVTSVTLLNQMVIPIAAATVAIPTPIGKKAAMIEPNTKPRMIRVRGPETYFSLD